MVIPGKQYPSIYIIILLSEVNMHGKLGEENVVVVVVVVRQGLVVKRCVK